MRAYARCVIEAKGTNGRVTFDGVLVTIHRGGPRAWVRGSGMRSIPARAITSVDLQPAGLGRGWIRFAVDNGDDEDELDDAYDDDAYDDEAEDGDGAGGQGAGGVRSAAELVGLGWLPRARRAREAGGTDRFDPARDPNTVLFARGRQRAFEDVRREVKTAIWQASRRGGGNGSDDGFDRDHTPTHPLAPHDPVLELRQLGQLLRDGVIDRREFERAKARLLDRI